MKNPHLQKDSSLICCLKCKGLFKSSEADHDKHVITCSGNPFKSPTNYFACERKIFLQLFQPEDFQLDGSFNLLNISKDDSFLNQVVKIRLPQETIDPLLFLRNYTSTGTEILPESGLDLLDENITDLDGDGEKNVTFVDGGKSAYSGTDDDDQIQNIINKNLDYLEHDSIDNIHPGDSKEPYIQSQSFLPESNVGFSEDSLNYAASQPVPFACNLSSDLLSDLGASHDQNQPTVVAPCSTLQHLELPKKDPFLGQTPSLTPLNSKDPFLMNAAVQPDKPSVSEPKNMPPLLKSVYDIQTSPIFQLQDGNYFNFTSMLDEPTQLDYLDLATLDFLTNPNFIYGPKEKDDFSGNDSSAWLDSNTSSLTLDSLDKFDKNTILPTKTRDDSAVDRKMNRIRLDKVKTHFPKKSKMYFNKPNMKSKSNENSPRNRRHSAKETDKTITKANPIRCHAVGQSKEAPEKMTERLKSSTRKRKLSLPSALETEPFEGQTKVKNERKLCGKSRLCHSDEIFNVKETLAGFSEEEKDSFKAVLGKNACVLVKKQKLMPYFKPPIIEQVNEIMSNNLKTYETRIHQNSGTAERETFIKSHINFDNSSVFHIRCPTCVYKCNTINELKQHCCSELSSSLKNQFMFTCFQCEFTCESVTVLAEHMKAHHPVKRDNFDTIPENPHENLENIKDYATNLGKSNLTDFVNQGETAQLPKQTELIVNGNPVTTTVDDTVAVPGNKPDSLEDDMSGTGQSSKDTCISSPDVQEAAPLLETTLNSVLEVCHGKNLKHGADKDIDEFQFHQEDTKKLVQVVTEDVTGRSLPGCLEETCCHEDDDSMFGGQDFEQNLINDSHIKQITRNSGLEYFSEHENSDNLNEEGCEKYISGNTIKSVPVEEHVADTLTDMVNLGVNLIEPIPRNPEDSQDKDKRAQSIMTNVDSVKNKIEENSDRDKFSLHIDMSGKCDESTIDDNQSLSDTTEQPTFGSSKTSVSRLNLAETNIFKEDSTESNKLSLKNTVDKYVFFQHETLTNEPDLCCQQEAESNKLNKDGSNLDIQPTLPVLLEDTLGPGATDSLMAETEALGIEEQSSIACTSQDKPMPTVKDISKSLMNKNEKISETELKGHGKDAVDQETCIAKDNSANFCETEHSYCRKRSTEPREDSLSKEGGEKTKTKKDCEYWYCTVQDCEFRTLYKRNLTVHKMKHDGVKRFLCDQCPYSTPDATCLSSHQKHNHSNEIRFKCTDCDFVSIMRIEILRHYRNIHLQQKIYACNQCEYRTGYTYLLKFHLMSHAGIKPFKCSLCDYQVCNSTKVTRHIKTVHVGQKEAKCIKLDLTFEIDAKQFKCAEPVSEKDIKVIELTEEEIKVYGEKRRKQAQLKKEEKERKKTARMPNKVVKTKSVKMVSLLGNIMDVRKEQDDADIIGQPLAH